MRANYRALGVKEMCRRLKRSKGSVTGKAVQMGLAGKWALVYARDATNESKAA
jgi:hypothetical protein